MVYEAGAKHSYAYDAAGNLIWEMDENGCVTQVKDAMGGVTAYTYDANNNLVSITAPRDTDCFIPMTAISHRSKIPMKCHITDRKVMKLSTEIEKIAKANKITVAMLTLEQVERIKDSIYQKYSNKNRSVFLWESLADFSIINDKDGWALSADFVQEEKCIMFFDECEDKACIEITGGKDLHKLLSEMYGFEFYITNFTTEYLVCFNHHDCLIGCGTAKEWINTLQN